MTTEEEVVHLYLDDLRHLDPKVSIKRSSYTNQYYVDSNIGIGDGLVYRGVTEHRPSPVTAVLAFVNRLKTLPPDVCVSVDEYHWRWHILKGWIQTHHAKDHEKKCKYH